MPTLDPTKLEESVFKHGVVLEQRILRVVEDTFESVAMLSMPENSLILRLPDGYDQKTIEIDIYANIRVEGHHPLFNEKGDKPSAEFLYDGISSRHFLLQAKGHEKDGYLLLRKAPSKGMRWANLYHRAVFQRENFPREFKDFFVHLDNIRFPFVLCDWARFFKSDYKQDGGRNKMLDAIDQLNLSVKGLLQKNVEFELGSRNVPWKILQQPVPVVVTNCQLVLMNIGESNAVFYENVPWAVLHNSSADEYEHKVRNFFVVSIKHLALFLERMKVAEIDLSYPEPLTNADHSFKIPYP